MNPNNPAQLHPSHAAVDPSLLSHLLAEHQHITQPRCQRLWRYFRNGMQMRSDDNRRHNRQINHNRPYTLAQEEGLPSRLRKHCTETTFAELQADREIVIENDIAWRIHTLVDFMFGKPVIIQSLAPDPQRAQFITQFLHEVFQRNGGIRFFQDLALLGTVYGYVDVLLRTPGSTPAPGSTPGTTPAPGMATGTTSAKSNGAANGPRLPDPQSLAHAINLETLEAQRIIPLLNPHDYRVLDAYVLHYCQQLHRIEPSGLFDRLRKTLRHDDSAPISATHRAMRTCTEIWTADAHQVFQSAGSDEKRQLLMDEPNRLGRIPVVHIQNLPQPFFYEGLSEVEPLIPLQDELNTRLSDRANRVTFQSFKMYLGKGIEQFVDRPVGPGQMWQTDNPDASIEAFGGDAHSPSEEAHIREIREALDKTSSVTPIAAGLLAGRIGNLSSENALRLTMLGLLARTDKKRISYGTGIEQICELILHAADRLNLFPNTPAERKIRLNWPSPLPANDTEHLRDALMKVDLGVPRNQVLAELGYATTETPHATITS